LSLRISHSPFLANKFTGKNQIEEGIKATFKGLIATGWHPSALRQWNPQPARFRCYIMPQLVSLLTSLSYRQENLAGFNTLQL
jgi:hypothetical protein